VTARVNNASLFFGNVIGKDKFSTEATAIATYRPRDIMLVLDVSGSMSESRGGMRKIDELRESTKAFLKYLRDAKAQDQVGFVYYSTTASLGSRLSLDLASVEANLMAKLTPGGWTNIADGMKLAIEELRWRARPNAQPLIVLLTDGAANMNQPGNWMDRNEAKSRVIQQADNAVREKLPIFTMALDSLTTEVDIALMQRVSEITGSESFHVIAGEGRYGSSELNEAFRRVAVNRPLRIVD
jgi:Mg-chelatase subunit ChlD